MDQDGGPNVAQAHVDSFNLFVRSTLAESVKLMKPVYITTTEKEHEQVSKRMKDKKNAAKSVSLKSDQVPNIDDKKKKNKKKKKSKKAKKKRKNASDSENSSSAEESSQDDEEDEEDEEDEDEDDDDDDNSQHYRHWVKLTNAKLTKPMDKNQKPIYPWQCRKYKMTYASDLVCTFQCYDDMTKQTFQVQKRFTGVPVMIQSDACHLGEIRRMRDAQQQAKKFIERHEEPGDFGGYFIVNGLEKLIRLLIMPRRNNVICLTRPTFTRLGSTYTPFATQIRSVNRAQNISTIHAHVLKNGRVTVRCAVSKREMLLPAVVLLKCFSSTTDLEIIERMMLTLPPLNKGGKDSNAQLREKIVAMIVSEREALFQKKSRSNIPKGQSDYQAWLGQHVRAVYQQGLLPADITDEEVAQRFLDDNIFIHLDNNRDKFELLIHMIQRLFALQSGEINVDNSDSTAHHETMLPGTIYSILLAEKLQETLLQLRNLVRQDMLYKHHREINAHHITTQLGRCPEIGAKMNYFLATGNLVTSTGLGLNQPTGWVIIAERLNYYRYLSHFRSIHRGSFFTEMKTTKVRKLLPESWGFLCPVHTPDGTPCGLLNHIGRYCRIQCEFTKMDESALLQELVMTGLVPVSQQRVVYNMTMNRVSDAAAGALPVMLNGRLLGWVSLDSVEELVDHLRKLKVLGSDNADEKRIVPPTLEIVYCPLKTAALQYPGVYLFSDPARFLRPVSNLSLADKPVVEWIGSFEQVFLQIACGDASKGNPTHEELDKTNMLSVIASLTPFSEFNPSPRNMYQCQMGKQSMGTPTHAYTFRADNKLYHLLTPQRPMVRTKYQDTHLMDDYTQGINAVVAVISYTGYDMEDAVIIAKGAMERGFAHGRMYLTLEHKVYQGVQKSNPPVYFWNSSGKSTDKAKLQDSSALVQPHLSVQGLPRVGQWFNEGDVMYVSYSEVTGKFTAHKYKKKERCQVQEVVCLGIGDEFDSKGGTTLVKNSFTDGAGEATNDNMKRRCCHVLLKVAVNRDPIIGDKFSSRHGQKGVLSKLWPDEDMPFGESGIRPDLIINPHAFPSRMTIGMLIESMAGKAACVHGLTEQDATPFQFSEKFTAVDFFGHQLKTAGYNYYGNEAMYSGISGESLQADIFIGVVHYQRLRHMISDKFQVRASGPISQYTKQPVKGRKKGGGIRFGEMERDSVLSHGAAYLVLDRLLKSSDQSLGYVCGHCGQMIGVLPPVSREKANLIGPNHSRGYTYTCLLCPDKPPRIATVRIPYVLKYLLAELSAMSIGVGFTV